MTFKEQDFKLWKVDYNEIIGAGTIAQWLKAFAVQSWSSDWTPESMSDDSQTPVT